MDRFSIYSSYLEMNFVDADINPPSPPPPPPSPSIPSSSVPRPHPVTSDLLTYFMEKIYPSIYLLYIYIHIYYIDR